MATEYGVRYPERDQWNNYSKSEAESFIAVFGGILIAREVSEPRVVSIRA